LTKNQIEILSIQDQKNRRVKVKSLQLVRAIKKPETFWLLFKLYVVQRSKLATRAFHHVLQRVH